MKNVTLGKRDTSETGTTNTVKANNTPFYPTRGSMSAKPNYEAPGAAAAEYCLNTILNSKDQAEACRAIIKMLDDLAGSGKIAKKARRGAAVALVNVLERGLGAISSDGGQ